MNGEATILVGIIIGVYCRWAAHGYITPPIQRILKLVVISREAAVRTVSFL